MPIFSANPNRDTLIESLHPTYNYGQRNTLWLDWFNPGGARVLLAWDVSSIPLGVVVVSATLDFVIQSNGLSGATGYGTYPASPDEFQNLFVEGTGTGSATGDGATWLTFDGSTVFSSPGGDYIVSSKSAFNVTTGETTKSIDVKTAVQAALNNYRDSNGWIAILLKRDDESGSAQTLRFWSNQAATPANRPVLTITYMLPDGIGIPIFLVEDN